MRSAKATLYGCIGGALALVLLWSLCIAHIASGNYQGHTNYYGQPVGAFLLLSLLVVMTPVFLVMIYRVLKGREPGPTGPPLWMNTPPWKWPWSR